ncbi:MAG: TetR/AcrR family transcriptional regulator [Bacillota bacterium]
MPKQTFFNLPAEKKQRIVAAAVDEFASFPYLKTSINRIIEKADIAKGSFYQYFVNKKDLYKYILDLAGETKLNFFRKRIPEYRNVDFFTMLKEIFRAGIEFKREYPRYSQIGDLLLKGENESLKKEIYDVSRPKTNDFYLELLRKAAEKGEVDKEIDLGFTSYLLTELTISVVDYYFKENGDDGLDDLNKMMVYLDKMLYIIKNGIAGEGYYAAYHNDRSKENISAGKN